MDAKVQMSTTSRIKAKPSAYEGVIVNHNKKRNENRILVLSGCWSGKVKNVPVGLFPSVGLKIARICWFVAASTTDRRTGEKGRKEGETQVGEGLETSGLERWASS